MSIATVTVPLVEKHRPQAIDDFAGLERPRAVLRTFAVSPYNSAWLFLGPSGTGKTTMALAFAKEIGAEVHHIPSRECDLATVQSITEKCWYVPFCGQWHMVLVDEADQMSRAAQLAFLSKLDTTAAPPNTIFVFTANATDLLEKRFLSRCRTLRFEHDLSPEPAAEYLSRIWNAEAAEGSCAPDFRLILEESDYNLRDALMRLELELIAPSAAGHRPGCLCRDCAAKRVTVKRAERMKHTDRSAAAHKAWETIRARRASAGAVA